MELAAKCSSLQEALIVVTEFGSFSSLCEQCLYSGLTTNMVENQVPGKQMTPLEISIYKIWDKRAKTAPREVHEKDDRYWSKRKAKHMGYHKRGQKETAGTVEGWAIFLETVFQQGSNLVLRFILQMLLLIQIFPGRCFTPFHTKLVSLHGQL